MDNGLLFLNAVKIVMSKAVEIREFSDEACVNQDEIDIHGCLEA